MRIRSVSISRVAAPAGAIAGDTHLNKINFIEFLIGWGSDNVEDGDDVLVVEMPEQLDLS
jgi:hypothetical protein